MTALAGLGAAMEFKAGTGGDPSTWADAPRPVQLTIRPGAGTGGSDRLTFVWADGAIRDRWLRVTIRAVPQLGLDHDDVFTFGHLTGETGDSATPTRVSALDLAGVRRALNTLASVTGAYDVNRDGRVNALDLSAVRQNLSKLLAPLSVPAAPALVAPGPSVRRVWDSME
jgi:hypothetical protein